MDDSPPVGETGRGSRKKAAPGYYLASEAAGKLRLARSTFHAYVEQGLILRDVIGEGKSEGQYQAAMIDALVPAFARRKSMSRTQLRAELIAVRERFVRPLAATDWITLDDLPFVQYLDLQLYGVEDAVPMTITWSWWQKNPWMCRILFNAVDRRDVWGVVSVMPLRQETIFRLLRHEMQAHDITPEDILTYPLTNAEGRVGADPPGDVAGKREYFCYIASLAIRPERRRHLRQLLQSLFDFWCAVYPTIKITRLYAVASTEAGMAVVSHLFFSPLYDFGEDAFELRPFRPNNPSRLVQTFQSCVERKWKGEEPPGE
jgi:hypothetical protein